MFTTSFPSEYEHPAKDIADIVRKLTQLGAEQALLKVLPKNANDKNQLYIASDFGVLFDLFAMTLSERGASTSQTKDRSMPGRRIPEATFDDFTWVKRDGSSVRAKRMKAIIYPQYPEARLSGFQAVDNTMPQSLSVEYTKVRGDEKRLLVLGQLPGGACVGLIYVHLTPAFEHELSLLPGFDRARACKRLELAVDNRGKLRSLLAGVVNRPLAGCRLDAYGRTLPFSGTQVCGYTLEHALNIRPNSGSDGDIFGIELKTHTQVKVTLFTPEPDFGEYAADFETFMKKYGYQDNDGDYRLTGIHRANVRCAKSKLTLKVIEYHEVNGVRVAMPYNPATPLTPKMDSVEVILESETGEIAAGWTLERLMNCWGAKHNEVVFIAASKEPNADPAQVAAGYVHTVRLEPVVMWCRNTSAERLLAAINDGVIYLDPAPKLHATDPAQNKRRAQWRVNDITKAVTALYSHVEFCHLDPDDQTQLRPAA